MSHLLLAGTEKSGTTSVFLYLVAHHDVVGSKYKETNYFRSSGPHSITEYEKLFPKHTEKQVCVEASPGYLTESDIAAPAIASVLPGAKLLFILRDPVKRLVSSFGFHKSRLRIPKDMGFEEYVDLCMQYDSGRLSAEQAGMDEWQLRMLGAGKYAQRLKQFKAHFRGDQINIMNFDNLCSDARNFMRSLACWVNIDERYYDNFSFVHANKTFLPRNEYVQKIGLHLNEKLTPLFYHYPNVKLGLLRLYKKFNERKEDRIQVERETEEKLVEYYANDVEELKRMVDGGAFETESWKKY